MKCVNCGAELAEDARFCSACGADQTTLKVEEDTELDNVRICPFCGAENDADAKFCAVCGRQMSPVVVAETSGKFVPSPKSKKKAKRRLIIAAAAVAFISGSFFGLKGIMRNLQEKEQKTNLLGSYGNEKTDESETDNSVNSKPQDVKKYIERHYGIADNPVFARQITHVEIENGTKTMTYDEEIKADSKGGSVFYKTVTPEGQPDGLVCVYLSDRDNKASFLKADYIYNQEEMSSGSYSITISNSITNTRCYAIVGNDYFAHVELSEQKVLPNNNLTYSEEISVYKMTGSSLDEMYTIRRELNSDATKLKKFEIKSATEWIIYAAGYSNYTAEGAEFVSTQQEFCDRANALLKNSSMDRITLRKTSWNNRWFGMFIDESGINDSMVKVDFSSAEPRKAENGDEITDIVIEINSERQELEEGEQLEEIEDFPVTYRQNTETITEDPVVMPENIPQSIDVNELQDLRYFNIDGFWHSLDDRYVYHIYTQHPDNGLGTLYFADLEGNSKSKHGHVKQTSSYSVILQAMDGGFSPEVYASNNQLVSDEITLVKADDWIVSSLMGSWFDDGKTYTFDSDGTYEVETSDDWYWGQYYIIDESRIVLGEHIEDLVVCEYALEGNTFILGDRTFVRQ